MYAALCLFCIVAVGMPAFLTAQNIYSEPAPSPRSPHQLLRLGANTSLNASPNGSVKGQQSEAASTRIAVWNFRTQICDSPVLDSVETTLEVDVPITPQTPDGRRAISGRVDSVRILNAPPAATFRVLTPTSPVGVIAGRRTLIIASFTTPNLGTSSSATLRVYSVDSIGVPIINDFPIITRRERRSFQLLSSGYDFGVLAPNATADITLPFVRNNGTVPMDWQIPVDIGSFRITSIRPAPVVEPGNTTNYRVVLQPGDTSFVTVRFLGAMAGQYLTYSTSPIDRICNVVGPLFTLEARTAQNPPNITVTPSGISTRPIDFGDFACANTDAPYKDTTLNVYNSGQVTLRVTGASFTLPDYQIISPTMLSESTPLLVPFNQSRDIIVRYTPRISMPNDRTARLTLFSNAQTGITTVTVTALKDSVNLSVSAQDLDFGTITRGAPALTRTLTITNTGTIAKAWLLPATLANGYVVESITPNPTPAGGTSQVTVRFANTSVAGQFSAVWNMVDDCSRQTPVTMRINIDKPRPGIGVASPINFSTLTCANDSTVSFTVRNTSSDGQDLIISQITLLGGASSPFSLVSQPAVPLSVRSGQPQTLQVRYRPNRTGASTDTLRFISNADDSPTFNVVLQGGKDSVGFALSRTNLRFVNIFPNIGATDTLTIRNLGTTPLTWGGRFTLGGAFTIRDITPPVTPVGGTSVVTVNFLGSATDASSMGAFTDACGRVQAFSVQATILPPRIAVTENRVFTPLSCEVSAISSVIVQNTGGQDLIITSIQSLQSGNASSISIDAASSASSLPIRIAGGRDTTLTVRFQPMVLGAANQTFRYLSNAINRDAAGSTSTTLSGIKNVRDFEWINAVEPIFTTFGSVPPNTPVTKTLTLRNTGNLPIQWNVPLRFGQDSVFSVESISPNPTMPGAMAQVTMRYAGSPCGRSYLTTQLTPLLRDFGFTCSKTSSVSAFAETLTATARLRLESVSGGIGDTVLLPLRLENVRFLREAGIREFSASLRFNRTIMYPLGTDKGSADAAGNRIIPLRLPLPNPLPADSVLARIPFRITLGNTTATQVFLDNPASGGICLNLDTASARTSASRICLAGGTRLVQIATTATALASAKPNPVTDISTIDLSLMERGYTTLTLYNTMGQAVKQLLGAEMEAGTYSLTADAASLPSGLYFMILQTPTERITRRLEVIR